jgi:hypothetical protein
MGEKKLFAKWLFCTSLHIYLKLCFKLDPKANYLAIAKNLPDWIKIHLPGLQKLQRFPHQIIK